MNESIDNAVDDILNLTMAIQEAGCTGEPVRIKLSSGERLRVVPQSQPHEKGVQIEAANGLNEIFEQAGRALKEIRSQDAA